MPIPLPARLPAGYRWIGAVLAVLAVVVLLLLSHTFGRAAPTGNYRPLMTADPIESGCYPLPGGASLHPLSYQVRWDGDVGTPEGKRRELRGQYNLVDADEAARLLVDAFTRVGFEVSGGSGAGHDPGAHDWVLRDKRSGAVVRIRLAEIPGTSEQTLVRGEFVLDLPVVEKAKDGAVCDDPRNTKRWGDREPAE